jgi:hypothetical protein
VVVLCVKNDTMRLVQPSQPIMLEPSSKLIHMVQREETFSRTSTWVVMEDEYVHALNNTRASWPMGLVKDFPKKIYRKNSTTDIDAETHVLYIERMAVSFDSDILGVNGHVGVSGEMCVSRAPSMQMSPNKSIDKGVLHVPRNLGGKENVFLSSDGRIPWASSLMASEDDQIDHEIVYAPTLVMNTMHHIDCMEGCIYIDNVRVHYPQNRPFILH